MHADSSAAPRNQDRPWYSLLSQQKGSRLRCASCGSLLPNALDRLLVSTFPELFVSTVLRQAEGMKTKRERWALLV